MPIRWYGPADPTNPTYQNFSRVVNLTLHGMSFAAVNSGLWFVQEIRHPWTHLGWFSGLWLLGLSIHLIVVIAMRPEGTDAQERS
ncbi:MAG: hypothetical protein AB8E74_01335 [Prochlorococcus sp.]|nr:hypothetical protein [Prochlorococcaceae cyanobacterium Fu_MAG_50]